MIVEAADALGTKMHRDSELAVLGITWNLEGFWGLRLRLKVEVWDCKAWWNSYNT